MITAEGLGNENGIKSLIREYEVAVNRWVNEWFYGTDGAALDESFARKNEIWARVKGYDI